MNHLLKKDEDFANDCYTEWQFNCNQNKATKVDENGNILKIRKSTYNEICKETIEDAMCRTFQKILRSGATKRLRIFCLNGCIEFFVNTTQTNIH